MRFCLRAKITLSLCDQSCTSSTKCARGVNPFDNSQDFGYHPQRDTLLASHIPLHKHVRLANLWGCANSGGVSGGRTGVESICDESEGEERAALPEDSETFL